MAIANIEFYSDCLKRNVTFKALLPTDTDGKDNPHYSRPMKTLVLLHGYCGMCADWIWNSQIMDISNRYNLCVLLPSGENSFYLDGKETGRKYGTFVGEELLAFARKTFGISQKREDTFVGGFSMGGFGAIHLGLQFNHNFGKLFGFALRAAWGITKIIFSIVLLPLFLIALVFMGLMWVALPVLVIVGIVSFFTCRN